MQRPPTQPPHAPPQINAQDAARDIFLAKQANERKERWVLGNFLFFRMHRVTDIYFVGGFGTVQWIDVAEYLNAAPDAIATNAPQRTLKVRALGVGRLGGCVARRRSGLEAGGALSCS